MKLNTNVSPDHFPIQIQLIGVPIIRRPQFAILLQLYDADLPDTEQLYTRLPVPTGKRQAMGNRVSMVPGVQNRGAERKAPETASP